MTEHKSIDDMFQNFSLGDIIDPDTLAQLRSDTISVEGGAGHIYLMQNAAVYECTVDGGQIIDKDGKVLSEEDETYQKIIRQSKLLASKDDTILQELFE